MKQLKKIAKLYLLKLIKLSTFSPITIPEATCIGYEQGARCMVPLLECMEDDEKEKLNRAFERDFQQLNNLLSNNGFPTCEAFGKRSFNAFAPFPENNEDDKAIEDESKELSFVSSPALKEEYNGQHFLPTKSPKRVGMKRKRNFRLAQKRKNYESFSKILI